MAHVTINVSIEPLSYENLEEYCRVLGLSKSRVINLLLKDPLNAIALSLACELVKSLRR
ncbi:hypothetical protein [Archaeoglobus profundus]|uniref:CopG n=1 Tax=Archaeoglobus profundus TaxID=84156 RepID=C6GAC1_ARCPR|nr:hypothetical protein [Archaeoglobus profundus]ACS26256.1 CopG [Archaeoglobus profundus]